MKHRSSYTHTHTHTHFGLPDVSAGNESAYNAGTTDLCSIPGSEKPPGEGDGNPVQYSCLENLKDRATVKPTVHKELDMTE